MGILKNAGVFVVGEGGGGSIKMLKCLRWWEILSKFA